ncbi:Structural maintenance of chromosomes protein 2 [Marasmius crinis-equi]|uniref:Structural maintenance of chromosomes protein 2 n=1 Tax=Marasmius crinis-equi TaxID=585013 RepID=A0ABR3FAX6_9AGAR
MEETCTEKEKEAGKINKDYNALKDVNTTMQDKLKSDEELLQTLLTGLSSNNANAGSGGGGYMGQLQAARSRRTQASAEEKQLKNKVEMTQKELRDVEVQWKKVEKDAGEGKKRLETMQGVVNECRRKLGACGWTEEMEKEGEAKLDGLNNEVERLTARRDQVRRTLGNMDFDYQTPGPHFDQRKVKGRLGTLVSLKPENYEFANALEVTAGSKLHQVVVTDETVSSELIKSGLKNRATFIPLTKINPYRVQAQKLATLSKTVPHKARLALDLVGYTDPTVEKAMSYTFGSTIIDGDSYDPSGSLTGGAKSNNEAILVRVQELLDVEAQLAEAKRKLREAESAWDEEEAGGVEEVG